MRKKIVGILIVSLFIGVSLASGANVNKQFLSKNKLEINNGAESEWSTFEVSTAKIKENIINSKDFVIEFGKGDFELGEDNITGIADIYLFLTYDSSGFNYVGFKNIEIDFSYDRFEDGIILPIFTERFFMGKY